MTNLVANKTGKILLAIKEKIFNKFGAVDHPFRILREHFDFAALAGSLANCYSEPDATGIAILSGLCGPL